MKKLNLLCLFVIASVASFAQMAVSTTNASPHASAMLDINNPNKGVLFTRVALQKPSDNVTIPSPATGLLVWNTNGNMPNGTGFYFNAGSMQAPLWKPLRNFDLPYYQATSESGAAFSIDNYEQVAASSAIRGFGGGNGRGVEGLSQSGTGVYASSVSGTALEVNGKLKISGAGQQPVKGKVLTTDDQGNASWQGAVAFAASGIPSANSSIPSGSTTKIKFETQSYDLSFNYNDAAAANHSTFIVPVNGIYHFDAGFAWTPNSASDQTFGSLYIMTKINGVVTAEVRSRLSFGQTFTQHNLSADLKLPAGSEVWIAAYQNSGENRSIETAANICFFNGHLVTQF